ncbi:MAG: DUF4266 domain-containing protein [Bacteroidia bacterium]|nr:DUF4266 domain-containing protein [Bacteroidia bacterium]NND53284.1 DUF4266 domain-containing protein [Flavobacteriaceae bacterium]
MKRLLKPLWIVVFLIYLTSCAPLKPYERVYVDDPEMLMITTSCKNYEHYVQSIREGAISVGGTKGNGGCGCN